MDAKQGFAEWNKKEVAEKISNKYLNMDHKR